MKYQGYLLLVFTTLICSVLIENRNLFNSSFFTIAYIAMSLVLIIGSRYKEGMKVDFILGLLLLFSVAFLSTETLIYIFTNNVSQVTLFKLEVIIALDYCALGFLRRVIDMRGVNKVIEDVIATEAMTPRHVIMMREGRSRRGRKRKVLGKRIRKKLDEEEEDEIEEIEKTEEEEAAEEKPEPPEGASGAYIG